MVSTASPQSNGISDQKGGRLDCHKFRRFDRLLRACDMRMRFKYALPVAQIAIAVFLLHQCQLWIIMTRRDDMPGPGPAAALLALINVPVALLRGVWFRSFDRFWPDWIFVVALAIFWSWVGREIESRLDRRMQVTIKSQLARLVTDVLLTVSGVSLIWLGHIEFRSFPWPYFIPSLLFSWFWIFGPPVLLGYDLFPLARRQRMNLRAGNR